ncbi:MAG: DUF2283 domain-containing protein [Dehalococcoidia bacterium]|nr:DUF2283 domain-containing protein [Dehalococcoidia bacterium]
MKVEYDREADALYIQFRPEQPDDNLDIEEGVTIDVDKQGHIIGIEILDASRRIGVESLVNVSYEGMLAEKAG